MITIYRPNEAPPELRRLSRWNGETEFLVVGEKPELDVMQALAERLSYQYEILPVQDYYLIITASGGNYV